MQNDSRIIDPSILNFKPDVIITIQVEISTGKTLILSGNGKPINPLYMCHVFAGILKANTEQWLKQNSLIIDPRRSKLATGVSTPCTDTFHDVQQIGSTCPTCGFVQPEPEKVD